MSMVQTMYQCQSQLDEMFNAICLCLYFRKLLHLVNQLSRGHEAETVGFFTSD